MWIKDFHARKNHQFRVTDILEQHNQLWKEKKHIFPRTTVRLIEQMKKYNALDIRESKHKIRFFRISKKRDFSSLSSMDRYIRVRILRHTKAIMNFESVIFDFSTPYAFFPLSSFKTVLDEKFVHLSKLVILFKRFYLILC